MKKACLFLLGLFSMLQLYCAEQNNVALNACWKKGDTRVFNYDKKRIVSWDDVETINESHNKLEVSVLDEIDDYYIMSWRYYDFSVNLQSSQQDEINRLVQDISREAIVFKVNKTGEILEIVNIDDLLQKTEKLISLWSNGHPEYAKEIETVKKQYLTKSIYEQYVLKDISRVFQFYSGNYEMDKEFSFASRIPVPIFNTSIGGKGFFVVKKTKEGILDLQYKVYAERAEIVQLLKELNDFAGQAPIDDREYDKIDKLEFSYDNEIEYDIESGWVLGYRYTTTVNMGNQTQVDEIVFNNDNDQ